MDRWIVVPASGPLRRRSHSTCAQSPRRIAPIGTPLNDSSLPSTVASIISSARLVSSALALALALAPALALASATVAVSCTAATAAAAAAVSFATATLAGQQPRRTPQRTLQTRALV